MHNPYFLPSGEVEAFNVVIEIPKGSQNKYELDYKTGLLFLDRVLYSSDVYPIDYGMIPSTKAGDGDAVDVCLFLTNPVPPLTIVKARAIGMISMIDSGEEDNKIMAVPVDDPRWKDITDISQLPEHRMAEIVDFMETYKRLQKKTVTVTGTHGADVAQAEVAKHLNNYTQPE
jgi:inorganic pyrophosphatase